MKLVHIVQAATITAKAIMHVCVMLLTAFCRPIQNPKEEVLLIEVWDSDAETVGVSEVKGVKGLAK